MVDPSALEVVSMLEPRLGGTFGALPPSVSTELARYMCTPEFTLFCAPPPPPLISFYFTPPLFLPPEPFQRGDKDGVKIQNDPKILVNLFN